MISAKNHTLPLEFHHGRDTHKAQCPTLCLEISREDKTKPRNTCKPTDAIKNDNIRLDQKTASLESFLHARFCFYQGPLVRCIIDEHNQTSERPAVEFY